MAIFKKNFLLFALFLVFFSVLISIIVAPTPVRAANTLLNGQVGWGETGAVAYGTQPQDIRITIAKIINVVLTFIGLIFIVLIIYAGFKYMTSGGNEEQAKKAIALLKNAVLGLIIILASWAITWYITNTLYRITNNSIDYKTYKPYR